MLETIRRTSICLLLSWIVFSQPANAENIKTVSMVVGEGLQLEDKTGFYADIFAEVMQQTDVQSDFSVLPFRRALKEFFSKEAECIWGLDANLLHQFQEDDVDLIESAPILSTQQYLFSTPGAPNLLTIDGMEGKTIGILNGANTEEIFGQIAAQIVTLPSQEAKIRMLMASRIDAIGAWVPDIYITMKVLGIDRNHIEPSLFISSSRVGIVCHKSTQTVEFIDAVNLAISAFVGSENYEDLLIEYGILEDLR